MQFRALASAMGVIMAFDSASFSHQDPCRQRRSLEDQVAAADVIVLGKITYDRDCDMSFSDGDRTLFPECTGRRADVKIVRTWKGNLNPGTGLGLIVLDSIGSGGLVLRKGETRVVFAKMTIPGEAWGMTGSCYFPEGFSSDSSLIKALDARGTRKD